MPIEIREIVIKTEIHSGSNNASNGIKEKDLTHLKKMVIEECKRIISENTGKKNNYKR